MPIGGSIDYQTGRTFTGAWIETQPKTNPIGDTAVAPLQVRGLKLTIEAVYPVFVCRTFTGAWIETLRRWALRVAGWVAPLQVRGLKLYVSGVVVTTLSVAPLQVRGLKPHDSDARSDEKMSHLYRCVD